MKPAALIYLQDSQPAQRLAVAWPLVPAGQREDPAAWARLAGLTIADAERYGSVLLAHGICLPDGTLDHDAENFIAAIVAASIPRKRTK
jgi:hypothetical protein